MAVKRLAKLAVLGEATEDLFFTFSAADREGNLRQMLAGLRDEISVMRRQLARWHLQECGGRTGDYLARALERVNGIAVATSSAALALEARLDVHAQAPAQ